MFATVQEQPGAKLVHGVFNRTEEVLKATMERVDLVHALVAAGVTLVSDSLSDAIVLRLGLVRMIMSENLVSSRRSAERRLALGRSQYRPRQAPSPPGFRVLPAVHLAVAADQAEREHRQGPEGRP